MIAKVKYQIADYRGIIYVPCNENDEDVSIIARAKAGLIRRSGPFPVGSENWKVTSRE